MLKYCIWHIGASVFLALFGAIYEHFSHNVYSFFMIYAFAIPLLFGALPCSVAAIKGFDPGRVAANLWNSAIATFATGCLFKGVLVIYGTTNGLIIVYPIAGAALAVAAVPAFLVMRFVSVKKQKTATVGE